MAEIAHQLHQAGMVARHAADVVEQQLDAAPAAGHAQRAQRRVARRSVDVQQLRSWS